MEPTLITLVPHTHWDREWYAPFDEFRERLVAMMDTLIELGNAGFPHFHLDGQTAMIDDYLAVRPEREADIRRLADDAVPVMPARYLYRKNKSCTVFRAAWPVGTVTSIRSFASTAW